MTFSELPLSAATRAALAGMQISEPTPIQEQTLPALLAGRDVIGQARTGSGKTLAFAIPMVERLRPGGGAAQALVLGPTRELASQVAGVIATVGRGRKLRVAELVGGRGFDPQAAELRRGAEVVVGTPGRVLDHLKQGTLSLAALSYAVLDEADEMLDKGFGPDVERILGFIPKSAGRTRQQHALFSATLPEWARALAAKLLVDPVVVSVDDGKPAGVAPESVDHVIYDVPTENKPAVLRALLNEDHDMGGATLVFGRTKHGVKKLAKQLEQEGYNVGALQANLSQNARDRVIAAFRAGEIPILVATNVAARGLDVAELGRVINYDLPENGALFTHRVGRTGRMGRAGQAITLLTPEDKDTWRRLERELKAAGLQGAFPRRPWTGPLPEVPVAHRGNVTALPAHRLPRAARPAAQGRPSAPAPAGRTARPAARTSAAQSPRPAGSARPVGAARPAQRQRVDPAASTERASWGSAQPQRAQPARSRYDSPRPSFQPAAGAPAAPPEREVRPEVEPAAAGGARRFGWATRQPDHSGSHAFTVAARAPRQSLTGTAASHTAAPHTGHKDQAQGTASAAPSRGRQPWRGARRPG